MKLFVVLWLLVASSALQAGELLSVLDEPPACGQPDYAQGLEVSFLEDSDKALSASQVAAMQVEAFARLGRDGWRPRFSQSAYWFQFVLNNVGGEACQRVLTVGSPRLEKVEVFTRQGEVLERQLAGSDVPLEDWSVKARHPRFLIDLPENSLYPVWVRVESESLIVLGPELWSEAELDNRMAALQLEEGLVSGATLVVAISGLLAAIIFRSYLLVASSLGLLGYLMVTLVVNGYLFYVPDLLPRARSVVAILTAVVFVLFYSYAYLLFRVARLPVWVKALVSGYLVVGTGLLLWGLVGDFSESRFLFNLFRYGTYLLIPSLLAVALIYRVRLSALAWGLAAFMLFQGVSIVTQSLISPSLHYGEDLFEVSSNLMMLVLVVMTVVSLSLASRKRELATRSELADVQESSRRRLQQMVELRTAQLQKSLSARELMVARVSHDLRAPLVGIIHQAQVMGDSDQGRHIERQARQQLALLDDLILLSGKELAVTEQNLQAGFLYAFLDEIEVDGRMLAERGGNRFQGEISSHLPPLVQIDFRPLRRVLLNLLGNAAKYTQGGVVTLRVERLGRELDRVRVRFEVVDTGVGVPEELRAHLTQPFTRGKQVSSTEGFGIGLSVVEELLGQMGSHLELYDNQPAGSVFGFEVAVPVAEESEVAAVMEETHAREVDGEGFRVVVVDDVELTRAFVGEILGGYGFDVDAVPSGREALELLEEEGVDLLVTDQLMPDMDGWGLLAEVRKHHPKLPVLLYSSMPPSPVARLYGVAFDATLLKPAASDEFLALVERLCREKRFDQSDLESVRT
ncbi:hybrid sensor histidine kinase/response regulator [Marinobacter zhejiangensis]|uniref:histidine kinase n=1 Tax=Marinobacter zhejiangensis TaxID=488535 RepID=A0A1I4PFM7_9GAMM|nr:ATP-binding protein [Marinobacter zhejiangensis]SFM26477.1 Signal transduction histidine kinase [Marinobacter zhejiangensis]